MVGKEPQSVLILRTSLFSVTPVSHVPTTSPRLPPTAGPPSTPRMGEVHSSS